MKIGSQNLDLFCWAKAQPTAFDLGIYMKARLNNEVQFLRHDLFGIFAKEMPYDSLLSLKKTCVLAYIRVTFYMNSALNPRQLGNSLDFFIDFLSYLNKKSMSIFLRKHYYLNSPLYKEVEALTKKDPQDWKAATCYALIAPVPSLKAETLTMVRDMFKQSNLSLKTCLGQSIDFLHSFLTLGTMDRNITSLNKAYLNLQSADLSTVNISEIDYSWGNYRNTNFRSQNPLSFYKTKFYHADLCGADISSKCFRTHFHFFSYVSYVNPRMRGAIYDSFTKFPKYFFPKLNGMTEEKHQFTPDLQ